MNTAAAHEVLLDICVDCDGSGSTRTGEREYETGVWVTVDCTACGGVGAVDARWVSECEGCKARFWTGEGCDHHGVLCGSCQPARCDDCADDARHDVDLGKAAEVLTSIRALHDPMSGRIDNWSTR